MPRGRGVFAAAAALSVAAVLALRPGESAQPWRETLYVFGTLVEIEIRGTAPETARAAMDELWRDLTGGRSEKLILKVKGREVEVPGFHNGVGRATFYDLCGRMLGPGDYLALAADVRVLFLDDIPQLSRRNFNEARRFVTLIDALYEAKVRLIASAAAKPEMLYVEGDGAFEFERTASRLREMQSDDWGRAADAVA